MKELLVLWRRGLNLLICFHWASSLPEYFPILSCFINRYTCTYLYLNLYKFNLMAHLGYLCLLPQNSKDFRVSELVVILKSNSLQINQIIKYREKDQNSTQQLKNKLQILRFYFSISRHSHTYRYIKCVFLGNFGSLSGGKVYIY